MFVISLFIVYYQYFAKNVVTTHKFENKHNLFHACETDLWLYGTESSNDDDDDCIVLDYFLGEPRAPVLFGEGSAPERSSEDYPRWERTYRPYSSRRQSWKTGHPS